MRKSRLLVVDDDESLRWVTKVQLEQSGYAVDAAPDGREALELLQQNGADLVITDLMMPGMSGLDLLKEIRSEYPDLAVIVVTAFGTVETAVEAMKAGAYDYITKPVNIDELKLIVGRALEHVDPERGSADAAQQPRPEVRLRKHPGPVQGAVAGARYGIPSGADEHRPC